MHKNCQHHIRARCGGGLWHGRAPNEKRGFCVFRSSKQHGTKQPQYKDITLLIPSPIKSTDAKLDPNTLSSVLL